MTCEQGDLSARCLTLALKVALQRRGPNADILPGRIAVEARVAVDQKPCYSVLLAKTARTKCDLLLLREVYVGPQGDDLPEPSLHGYASRAH